MRTRESDKMGRINNDAAFFMSYVRGEDRGQVALLPAAIEDYVTADAPVRVIDAFVPVAAGTDRPNPSPFTSSPSDRSEERRNPIGLRRSPCSSAPA